MKLFYIKFCTGDWLKDPSLSICSPSTRGIWMDIVCRLHEMQSGGKLTANLQQISRLCRCSEPEARAALAELATSDTADVYEDNELWTITCRRMRKIAEISEKRQQAGSKGAAIRATNREANPHQNCNCNSNCNCLERVREFARGEGIQDSDADWFYFKGEGNGWTNGGEPIRDWKATLTSWKRAGYLPSQKNNGQKVLTFTRQKERPPIYDKLPPSREPSEDEFTNARRIAAEEKEKLRTELNR